MIIIDNYMKEKIKRTLEKIICGVGLVGSLSLLGYGFIDSIKARVDIEREAQNKNLSVYEVAKEEGRSDVIDMHCLEQGVKHLDYINNGSIIIPVYKK